MARYFVMHRDGVKWEIEVPGKPFEIQVLDSRGRAKVWGYVGDHENELRIDGVSVPHEVLEAARRQPAGQSDYVDQDGSSIPFF